MCLDNQLYPAKLFSRSKCFYVQLHSEIDGPERILNNLDGKKRLQSPIICYYNTNTCHMWRVEMMNLVRWDCILSLSQQNWWSLIGRNGSQNTMLSLADLCYKYIFNLSASTVAKWVLTCKH